MAVLISGGSGFVGLAVTEALLARGEHVVIYAVDPPPADVAARLGTLQGRLTIEIGDVRESDRFADCLRRHAVDRLLPFAAITSGLERERSAPESVLEVNLLGFVAQMRAARDAGVRRVIAPSSTAVYGESFYGSEKLTEEGTPCMPISMYGVSKYAVERSALRLGALWGLDVIAMRLGAVFGPWERDTGLRDMLGPHWQLARAALLGREAVLPAVIQPYSWVYARDAAAAILHLLDLPTPPLKVYNLCSGMPWGPRILEWCALLGERYPNFRWRQANDPAEVNIRFSEVRPRALMNIDRLMATGWAPAFAPEQAYPDYLRWLKDNAAVVTPPSP